MPRLVIVIANGVQPALARSDGCTIYRHSSVLGGGIMSTFMQIVEFAVIAVVLVLAVRFFRKRA